MLRIPTASNELPRTSFSAVSKDLKNPKTRLDETVVIGWTRFLTGNSVISLLAALYREMSMRDQSPKYIGGVDSFLFPTRSPDGAEVWAISRTGPSRGTMTGPIRWKR